MPEEYDPYKEYKLYDEEGKVEDQEIAEVMANIEDAYHKKTLRFFHASKHRIKMGEKEGEKKGLEMISSKNFKVGERRIEDIKKRIFNFEVSAEYTERDGGIPLGPAKPLRVRNASFILDGKKWNVQFEISEIGYFMRSVVIDGHKITKDYTKTCRWWENFAIHRKFSDHIGYHCGLAV